MASVTERAGVIRDPATGEMIIPASQRPDGTWRKARRVRDGYVPQEEVPAFETKGNQFAKSKPQHPIGLGKEDVEKMKKVKDAQIEASTNAAMKSKSAKRKEGKRKKEAASKAEAGVESVAKSMADVTVCSSDKLSTESTQEDLVKKIRNLKKKLRQVEDLEAKIASGDIKEPNKDQMDKIQKKQILLDEMNELESKVDH